MSSRIQTFFRRLSARGIPHQEEIEQFGSDGEERVYRMLCKHFDCVIRNVTVPHKEWYLEKDFMVIHRGVPFVLEVKNWKGEIGCRGDVFYQRKSNGTYKELKSPVGTTNQFIHVMKKFYRLERPVWGIVAFVAERECTLDLPESMDGVALLLLSDVVDHIKRMARREATDYPPVEPARLLRCTRLYARGREFCKGILANHYLECLAEDGATVRLDTTRLRFITVKHQPLRLRDKLLVTFDNGTSGVFYVSYLELELHCLDGTWKRIALNRIRHVVF